MMDEAVAGLVAAIEAGAWLLLFYWLGILLGLLN